MTFSPKLQHEFVDCLHALHEGTAQAGQSQRVSQLLTQYEEARQLYLDHVALFVALQWTLRRQPLATELTADVVSPSDALLGMATHIDDCPFQETESVALAARRRGIWRIAAAIGKPVTWSILACGVLFAAYIALISWGILDRGRDHDVVATSGTEVENQKLEIDTVATIRQTADVEWSDRVGKSLRDLPSASRRDASTEVAAGEPLSITTGLVELQLKQGVTLLIEGPAKWSIDGSNKATLKRGKLVAKVPANAIGFTVHTPDGDVVDLGTEFGVEVQPGQQVQVHVFRGKVRMVGGTAARAATSTLHAGQAAAFAPDGGPIVAIPAAPHKFSRDLDGTTVRASFAQDNGDATVDQFPGRAGDGWLAGWKVVLYGSRLANPLALVDGRQPLSADGGPALAFEALAVENLPPKRHASLSRCYQPGRTFGSAKASQRISFRYRFDSPIEDYFGPIDGLTIFDHPRESITSSPECTWIIRNQAAAADGGSAREWVWMNGDRAGGLKAVPTGMFLERGVVYEFAVTVHPQRGEWSATISDGQQTVDSAAVHGQPLKFRSAADRTGCYLHFGMDLERLGQPRRVTIDDLRIELLPSSAGELSSGGTLR
jgi:hypothetical protein